MEEREQTSTGPFYASDFGAVGDGVTDDTAAIQAAVDASAAASQPAPIVPWWRRRPMQLLAASAAVAVGVGIYLGVSGSPAQVHVHGTLTLGTSGYLPDGTGGCEASGGYGDITAGTAVTVGGPTGQTLAIGSLSAGKDQGSGCVFSFDVAVPGGQSIYTVTISHRGTQTLTPDEVAGGVDLTLGQ